MGSVTLQIAQVIKPVLSKWVGKLVQSESIKDIQLYGANIESETNSQMSEFVYQVH